MVDAVLLHRKCFCRFFVICFDGREETPRACLVIGENVELPLWLLSVHKPFKCGLNLTQLR